jgi:hypothetical protein
MIDYLRENIDEQSMKSFENSDVILAIILSGLDIILIVVSILSKRLKNKQIRTLKSRLYKIFILDIIIRALYVKKYYLINLPKEILFSVLATSQFYYILSFIDHSKYIQKELKANLSKERKLRIQLCFFFIFLSFSYENFSFKLKYTYHFKFIINKTIIIIKNYCMIIFVFNVYKILNVKIQEFANKLLAKHKNSKIAWFIFGCPAPCCFLFCLNYVLKIGFAFVNKPIFFIYGNIIINIVKDTSKYFLFLICESIFYLLYFEKIEEEKEMIKASTEEKIKINN